jgi:hypothetical protein
MDRHAQITTSRSEISKLDDLTGIRGEISKLEIKNEQETYNFNL